MFGKKYFNLENIFFYCLIVISLINIWAVNIYVTLDGPGHLHNSGLLKLVDSNSFLNDFYIKNSLLLPNYFSHIFLSNLFLIFEPFTSEKIFLSFIVVMLPLSFRYVVKLYAKNTLFSFLIFPLVFSFLFHLGFFNFCVAFIFLNYQLALLYFFLNENRKWYHFVLFVVNSILLFNAHAFVFIITGVICFLITTIHCFKDIKVAIKKTATLFLLFLPACTLFFIFYFNYSITDYDYTTTNFEKFSKILNFSSAVVYDPQNEGIKAGIYFIIFFFLTSLVFLKRFVFEKSEKKIQYYDAFLFLAIILIPIIIKVNSGLLGGMLTDRLVFIFFYFIAFWVALNTIQFKMIYYVSVISVIIVFWQLSSERSKALNILNGHAQSIVDASVKVNDNSTVFSANYSDNWLETNFSNYLAINRSVVNLYNYEALLGWFPLRWKSERFLRFKCKIDTADSNILLPDYVLIYGNRAKIDLPANSIFKDFVNNNTQKIYESEDKFCALFKVKK